MTGKIFLNEQGKRLLNSDGKINLDGSCCCGNNCETGCPKAPLDCATLCATCTPECITMTVTGITTCTGCLNDNGTGGRWNYDLSGITAPNGSRQLHQADLCRWEFSEPGPDIDLRFASFNDCTRPFEGGDYTATSTWYWRVQHIVGGTQISISLVLSGGIPPSFYWFIASPPAWDCEYGEYANLATAGSCSTPSDPNTGGYGGTATVERCCGEGLAHRFEGMTEEDLLALGEGAFLGLEA